MTTSEPTTGEIVRALRCIADDIFDATSVTNVLAYLDTVMGLIHCADGIKDLIVSMQGTAEELTARAEQAEKERDAAIEHVHDAIFGTNHSCFYCTMENCDGCTNSTVKEHFKYRGLRENKYLVKSEESGKENG